MAYYKRRHYSSRKRYKRSSRYSSSRVKGRTIETQALAISSTMKIQALVVPSKDVHLKSFYATGVINQPAGQVTRLLFYAIDNNIGQAKTEWFSNTALFVNPQFSKFIKVIKRVTISGNANTGGVIAQPFKVFSKLSKFKLFKDCAISMVMLSTSSSGVSGNMDYSISYDI